MSFEIPLLTDVILIGPKCAGKSTVGKLLAKALDVPHVSLNSLCYSYYHEIGTAEIGRHCPDGMLSGQCNIHAVERVLSSHTDSVIDFGAGHQELALFLAAVGPALAEPIRDILRPATRQHLEVPGS